MVVTEPLRVTNLTEGYDIDATIDGGGVSGQAGAMRLGIARSHRRARPRAAPHPQEGRPPHPRRPREGEQEVRPEEGPQGAAVLQAVAGRGRSGSAPTASAGSPTPSWGPSWSWRSGGPRPGPCPSPAFLVGRDTRRSGPLLQAALSAGMASEGADVVDLGVLPTPGVAWLSAPRGRPGRRGLGLAQPLLRQRRQALRRRRAQAPDATERADRGRARPGCSCRRRGSAPSDRPRGGSAVGRARRGATATSTIWSGARGA